MKRNSLIVVLALALAVGFASLLLSERPGPGRVSNTPVDANVVAEPAREPVSPPTNNARPTQDAVAADPTNNEPLPTTGERPRDPTLVVNSGPGAATGQAEHQTELIDIPVHRDYERFIEQRRDAYWADSTEALIVDGINFSAFGDTFSGWAVECRQSMCLVAASTDANSYEEQQRLPQGSWMSMMRTIRQDVAPVVPFANDGVSSMRYMPETGRIWLLELWWLPEGGPPDNDTSDR